jgi:hypothetical protein
LLGWVWQIEIMLSTAFVERSVRARVGGTFSAGHALAQARRGAGVIGQPLVQAEHRRQALHGRGRTSCD